MFILDLQRQRLNTLETEYQKELTGLKEEFDYENKKVTGNHTAEQRMLQDVIFAMEQNHSEREADARQDFQSMRDEIKNKVCLIKSFIMLL